MATLHSQARKWIYPKIGVAKLKDFNATDADRFFNELAKSLSKRPLMMIKSTLRRSIENDSRVIRNKAKIRATVDNAREVLAILDEYGSVRGYLASVRGRRRGGRGHAAALQVPRRHWRVAAVDQRVARHRVTHVCRLAARNVDAIAPVSLNGQALCPCRGRCLVRTRLTYAPSPPCSAPVPGRVGACGSAAACL